MNCLEIYWGLHVLMFAYSHLPAYPHLAFSNIVMHLLTTDTGCK